MISVRAERARRDVEGVMGFEPPSWQAAAAGARPEARENELYEPGTIHPGGTTIPCFLLQASSRTGAGIGEVPSRFWGWR